MIKNARIIALFGLLSCFLLPLQAQEIDSLLVCENVVELEPQNPKDSFEAGSKAYCWMKVKGATVGDSLTIAWYHEDELKHSTTLELSYTDMRTYAYKTLFQAGAWRVDIKSADDKVLTSLAFTATP